jgi:anti-sigma regulatory factor (Ser/Thr protein kinase)
MFEITIPAKEESISQVREFYQHAANDCGLSAEKVYAVLTAVEEAVWNIIEHSYVENDSGQIHCRAESTPHPGARSYFESQSAPTGRHGIVFNVSPDG